MSSGYVPTPEEQQREFAPNTPMPAWQAGIGQGRAVGEHDFITDPGFQEMLGRRQDLAQGYNGQELGALKSGAMHEIQGQRQGYLNNLRGNLAKQGVGGARAAAMQGAADQKFAGTQADAEGKILLDSAKVKRQGIDDLQDFLFKQKYGVLGTGIAYGQIAQAAAANTKSPSTLPANFNPYAPPQPAVPTVVPPGSATPSNNGSGGAMPNWWSTGGWA